MLAIFGFLQGALVFAGIGLGINLILFDQVNGLFLFLLATIGGMVGSVAVLFLRTIFPENVWAISFGSCLTAVFLFGLFVTFDLFLFGENYIHWRFLISLGLCSTGPGVLVGWVLAQQLGGFREQFGTIETNSVPDTIVIVEDFDNIREGIHIRASDKRKYLTPIQQSDRLN